MATAKRLAGGDLAGFRTMNAIFAEAFEEPSNYAERPPSNHYCEDWLANPENIAILGCEGDRAVGALAGYVLNKFEQDRRELYIYDLAVLEPARRRGVASAMIEEMRRIARDVGAWTVYVQADVFDEDEPARLLYRKFASEEIMAHHFDIKP